MGHWYDKETGEPRYRIVGANGKERDTTLADARKHKYVPSVTTILQIPSKPMLDVWKQNQLLEAVIRSRSHTSFSNTDQWKAIIIAESQKIGKDTAKRGSEIHDELEAYFRGDVKSPSEWIKPVIDVIEGLRPEGWVAEQSFAHDLGFGGRVDLYHPDGIIVDFKTKFSDGDKFKKINGYDENLMQLAAYEVGLGNLTRSAVPQLINIYISTLEPGLIYTKVWSEEEGFKGWSMFKCLLDYWNISNNIVR